MNQKLASLMLKNNGFSFQLAENGQEAIAMLRESAFDLVLMDLQMPVLDGIETTRLLKAAAATRDIPVIAHTARPDKLSHTTRTTVRAYPPEAHSS